MPQSSENNLLRFGCPACGVRLVVDQSIAGTEGPCPSCGARIVAPPLEVARSLVEKQAAPVAIKPRGALSPSVEPSYQTPGPSQQKEASLNREPISKPVSRKRSVSPKTIMSRRHTGKQNAKVFVKMLLALFVVVAAMLAVYYVVSGAE
jgi:hypothetical protein